MIKFFKNKQNKPGYNWYTEKVQTITIQRNILLLLTICVIIALSISIISTTRVLQLKTLDPFIIQIDKKSGVTTLVNPVTVKSYAANRAVQEYFLVKYINAREKFEVENFRYSYYKVTRLFSSPEVYSQFKVEIRSSNPSSPINLYSDTIRSTLKIKSIQHTKPNSVQIRFSVEFTKENDSIIQKDKIATISYDFVSLQMSQEERYINPLGFTVTSYVANDDYS